MKDNSLFQIKRERCLLAGIRSKRRCLTIFFVRGIRSTGSHPADRHFILNGLRIHNCGFALTISLRKNRISRSAIDRYKVHLSG